MPAMLADDQTGTSESPCSPAMQAWTDRGSTLVVLREQHPEAGGVEDRPRPDDALRRQAADPPREVREHVDRVGRDEDDPVRVRLGDRRDERRGRSPRSSWTRSIRVSPGCWAAPAVMHGDRGAAAVLDVARPDARRPRERDRVHEVHRLALGLPLVRVDQHDLAGRGPTAAARTRTSTRRRRSRRRRCASGGPGRAGRLAAGSSPSPYRTDRRSGVAGTGSTDAEARPRAGAVAGRAHLRPAWRPRRVPSRQSPQSGPGRRGGGAGSRPVAPPGAPPRPTAGRRRTARARSRPPAGRARAPRPRARAAGAACSAGVSPSSRRTPGRGARSSSSIAVGSDRVGRPAPAGATPAPPPREPLPVDLVAVVDPPILVWTSVVDPWPPHPQARQHDDRDDRERDGDRDQHQRHRRGHGRRGRRGERTAWAAPAGLEAGPRGRLSSCAMNRAMAGADRDDPEAAPVEADDEPEHQQRRDRRAQHGHDRRAGDGRRREARSTAMPARSRAASPSQAGLRRQSTLPAAGARPDQREAARASATRSRPRGTGRPRPSPRRGRPRATARRPCRR